MLILLAPLPALAQPDPSIPVYIHAEDAEMNQKTGISKYRGQVRVAQSGLQESISLQADEIIVYTSDQGLESIVATGKPVKYQEHERDRSSLTAESSRYEYSAKDRQIVLTGNAVIGREGNLLRGERIVYNLSERSAKVVGKSAGKSRSAGESGVGMTIMPSSDLVQDNLGKDGQ